MKYCFVDFETFFDSKAGYTLKKMSMTEYIRDSRFHAFGVGVHYAGVTEWVNDPRLLKFIDWSDTALVAHNIKFDGSILKWIHGITPKLYIDTVSLAKAVLGPSVSGYSLGNLAVAMGLQTPKGELKIDGLAELTAEQEQVLASYCLNDVSLCKEIFDRLIKAFPQGELASLDWTARAFIEPKLVLDSERLKKAVEDEKRRREAAIEKSGFTKAQLSSNAQFAEVVRASGLVVPTKISGRTGAAIPAFSRTDEGLRELERLAPALYEGRLAAKSTILETRAAALYEISKTGPWPFDVSYSGAVQTHRYSGASGAGGNPQNFPKSGPIRESVVAPDGHTLVVGDFAQIEARLVSWLAQEPKLTKAFAEGRDIYSEFASELYGREITKEDEKERKFGKEGILGLGYGMGWEKFKARVRLVMGVDIEEAEARRIVGLYRELYFNVPRLWTNAERLLPLMRSGSHNRVFFAPYMGVKQDALVLPSGLTLKYPKVRISGTKFGKPRWVCDTYVKKYLAEESDLYGGKLVENICQALAGEICKLSISRARAKGLLVAGMVHDEIICVAKACYAEAACNALRTAMTEAFPWLPSLVLKAEVGHGKSWAQAKAGGK
jgi:DNA polymerase family A/3'-5' exonuclease